MDIAAFLAMGGYGVYVWPAYLASLAGLVSLVVVSIRERAALERVVDEASRGPSGPARQKPSDAQLDGRQTPSRFNLSDSSGGM